MIFLGEEVLLFYNGYIKLLPEDEYSIIVDGYPQSANETYIFETTGEHEVIILLKKEMTSMKYMFYKVVNMTKIDFSKLNTDYLTDTSGLLSNCEELIDINFDNIHISLINNMRSMFKATFSLKSLNLTSFNTSSVTDMSYMFYGYYLDDCTLDSELNSNINISNFDSSKRGSLELLDISTFDTSRVLYMGYMLSR